MEKIFRSGEKMKVAEAVSRLIDESPAPTKIELIKSEQGFFLASFESTVEDEIVTRS